MSVTATEREPVAVGHYDFESKIGKGGMGSVYKARNRGTGEVVAVKVLTADLVENPRLFKRFEQEFRAAAKLDHPNIVRVLDFGMDGPHAYLVMEYVEGESLGQLIEKHGRLAERAAVRIVTQVAQALNYAHGRRIIHRDVKPDNVIVRPDGLAKLADFGLAKDVEDDQGLTRTARGLGTPHFMAPEQYRDAKNAGIPCDVYALGATLYTAVTGRLPFDNCNTLAALAQKIQGDVTPPRKLVPQLSEQVDAAIRKAMSAEAPRRPASCLEFVRLLPAARQRKKESAAPGQAAAAERRKGARHPYTLGTTCVIDTAVFTGTAGSEEAWPATVHDLATAGVGLVLARRFERGTEFTVEVQTTDGKPPRNLAAKVAHVRAEGLGHWFHGCVFAAPLTEQELVELLRTAK